LSSERLDFLDFFYKCLKDTIDDLDERIAQLDALAEKLSPLLFIVENMDRLELKNRFKEASR